MPPTSLKNDIGLYMSEVPDQSVAIFTQALEHPMSERGAFLDRACADDYELRRKIEALLGAYERIGGFMETPLVGAHSSGMLAPRIDQELSEPNTNKGASNGP